MISFVPKLYSETRDSATAADAQVWRIPLEKGVHFLQGYSGPRLAESQDDNKRESYHTSKHQTRTLGTHRRSVHVPEYHTSRKAMHPVLKHLHALNACLPLDDASAASLMPQAPSVSVFSLLSEG